jgi:hypothetical protein
MTWPGDHRKPFLLATPMAISQAVGLISSDATCDAEGVSVADVAEYCGDVPAEKQRLPGSL